MWAALSVIFGPIHLSPVWCIICVICGHPTCMLTFWRKLKVLSSFLTQDLEASLDSGQGKLSDTVDQTDRTAVSTRQNENDVNEDVKESQIEEPEGDGSETQEATLQHAFEVNMLFVVLLSFHKLIESVSLCQR